MLMKTRTSWKSGRKDAEVGRVKLINGREKKKKEGPWERGN